MQLGYDYFHGGHAEHGSEFVIALCVRALAALWLAPPQP
jgi:hypothetical protein